MNNAGSDFNRTSEVLIQVIIQMIGSLFSLLDNEGYPTLIKLPTTDIPGAVAPHTAENLVNIRIKPEKYLLVIMPCKLSGITHKFIVFTTKRKTSIVIFVIKNIPKMVLINIKTIKIFGKNT